MIAILALLNALLFRSILEELLKSMPHADRKKYNHGESVSRNLRSFNRDPQSEDESDALKYYNIVMANVEERFQARLAKIIKSKSDCFIEVLRLSGFPEVMLCSSNVYHTIMFAYAHIKSMSNHLQTICLDSPDLLCQLDAYSKLLVAFTSNIISEMIQKLPKTENELVTDINAVYMTGFYSFNQIFEGLIKPSSVEFKKIHAFAILNAAMREEDVSEWSSHHFETMRKCVVSILGDSKLTALQKLEFIMEFVPKLVKLLEETSFWKESQVFFGVDFKIVFDNIRVFSQPGFLQPADYTTVLAKFPKSGFPSTLQELPAFVQSKLWDNYIKLKDL